MIQLCLNNPSRVAAYNIIKPLSGSETFDERWIATGSNIKIDCGCFAAVFHQMLGTYKGVEDAYASFKSQPILKGDNVWR